ncbi:Flp pilus assembly protein CpaB [Kribbia dieselivorans]|uniref:Flp pilus assembly protein CpaB n=1 Tax=Kribbia dieselivorans TaxID=331526 RepID=UPI0008395ABF|nr:RcpC/CpaB family pilus assembly protein [Kribbia dieselivorans]
MNRRTIAVIVAILLALAGTALVFTYVQGADARAVEGQQPVKVYVVDKPISAGTTLKDAQRSKQLVETRVAADARPTGALEDIDSENSNLLALTDIQAGEFVMAARFGTRPVGEKAIEIPAGKLAMSVELSDPARIGKFVTPGSDITVFATHAVKALGEGKTAKQVNDLGIKGTTVLLPKVEVIAMGDTPLAAPQNDDSTDKANTQQKTPSFLVTVAVTPDQATRLAHGINEYTLYAGLRGADVKMPADGHTDDVQIFKLDLNTMLQQAGQ